MEESQLTSEELAEAWPVLSLDERISGFRALERVDADDFFHGLGAHEQAALIEAMPSGEQRLWMRLLAPDDAADVVQEAAEELRGDLLGHLEAATKKEVTALLAYAEDAAGGLMSPRFARLRPDMTVDEALSYLRKQAQANKLETIYQAYVLDADQHLEGVVSFRELFAAPSTKRVNEVMETDIVTVRDDLDQEAVARVIAKEDLAAVPVVDHAGRMRGIVTVDDVVDVVEEEATEDIQKLGGMEALDTPYLETPFTSMVKKRAGWLSALFLGEMLTASAMGHYETQIAKAVILALFVPLIISSGGNSGSQATTLVIRAMALGEVGIKDWFRIVRRELMAGIALGLILATIGMVRILVWQGIFHTYGAHYVAVAATVAVSLVGVVMWGTMSGAMLPFIIRRFGFDPASASAPFVATLVDVSGLIIYFNVAQVVLRGSLL